MKQKNYRVLVREAVLDEAVFIRITLSGVRGAECEWEKITARPVRIKGERQVQVSYQTKTATEAHNFAGAEFEKEVDRMLAMPFSRLNVQSSVGDLHIRISKKGKALISRAGPSRSKADLDHNRKKQYPLPAEGLDDFLSAIGIKNERGDVRPSMQAKFRQINGFISIAESALRDVTRAPLHLVDCGCGSAHLTFAFYHYISNVRGMEAKLVGIDRNAELIGKCLRLRDQLGWSDLDFQESEIAAYKPDAPPDIVFCLHACDTATDEAIALGVEWGSSAIVAAPCCQHELHHKLKAEVLEPVLQQGILRERLADIVTDTFRTLVLEIMGYKVEVVEFVAPEFTPKNLIIRAEKSRAPGDLKTVRQYIALKEFWSVEPAIEAMLGEPLRVHLEKATL